MRIYKLSSSCGKTYGKPKGHLDTQLFPECEGTKYDRNIVRKTIKERKRRRKLETKTAVRTKKEVPIRKFMVPEGGADTSKWQIAWGKAVAMYREMKKTMGKDKTSNFFNDDWVVSEIKNKLMEEDATVSEENKIGEKNADLAATSVLHTDIMFRKQNKTSSTPASQPTQPNVVASNNQKAKCGNCTIK